MVNKKTDYVEVCYHDWCSSPNNYRVELNLGSTVLIPDDDCRGLMSKRQANNLATKLANKLGIKALLDED